jgi:phosphoribosylformimino-5-aminoimidazole carboxamide ribotide isomerase
MLLIPGLELRNAHIALPNPKPNDDEPLLYLDAVETIGKLVTAGAERVHLIDADGAQEGEPVNTDIVQRLHKEFPKLAIEVTGGVRKIEHAELWLDIGARFVVLTWKLLRNPDATGDLCAEYPGAVVVAIEARDGVVQNGGGAAVAASELARRYSEEGVAGLFYTELHAPGERTDPLPSAGRLAQACDIPVFCNGGLHELAATAKLKTAPQSALAGVVVGRALLNGQLDFAAAKAALKKH